MVLSPKQVNLVLYWVCKEDAEQIGDSMANFFTAIRGAGRQFISYLQISKTETCKGSMTFFMLSNCFRNIWGSCAKSYPLNIFILIHQLPDDACGCSLGNLQFPCVRKVGQTYSFYLTVFSTPEAKCWIKQGQKGTGICSEEFLILPQHIRTAIQKYCQLSFINL